MTAPMVASRVDATEELTLPLTRLRDALLRELVTQTAQAAESRTTVNSLTGQTDVDSVLAREMAEASAGRADNTIAEVHQALLRLDDGTYGACEQCGAALPIERLQAIPYARRCVNCPGRRSGLFG